MRAAGPRTSSTSSSGSGASARPRHAFALVPVTSAPPPHPLHPPLPISTVAIVLLPLPCRSGTASPNLRSSGRFPRSSCHRRRRRAIDGFSSSSLPPSGRPPPLCHPLVPSCRRPSALPLPHPCTPHADSFAPFRLHAAISSAALPVSALSFSTCHLSHARRFFAFPNPPSLSISMPQPTPDSSSLCLFSGVGFSVPSLLCRARSFLCDASAPRARRRGPRR